MAAGSQKNKKSFNGIEETKDLDLNQYDAFFRTLDPQLGRWRQLDPKPNYFESPYSAMGNNPIKNMDFLGDTARTKKDLEFLKKTTEAATNKQEKLKRELAGKEKILEKPEKLSDKKRTKYEKEKDDLNNRINSLEDSKTQIQNLIDDKKHGYSFVQDNFAEHGYLYFEGDGGVVVHMMAGIDNALHEIDHAENFRVGIIKPNPPLPTTNYRTNFPDENEVSAYKRQYAYDPRGIPRSDVPNPASINEITIEYYHGTDIYKKEIKDH